MKKFTKGMLTLTFAIVMLLGLTISVHAADYVADDPALESGITLQQGDTVQLVDSTVVRIIKPYQFQLVGSSSVVDVNGGATPIGNMGFVEVEQEGNLLFKTGSGVPTVEVYLPEHADAWTIIKKKEGNSITYEVSYVHIHNDGAAFEPWTDRTSMPSEAGNYYLTHDVTLTGAWDVPSGTTNLCLNGYGITGLNGSAIKNSGATLNLYDCNSTQQTHYFTVDSSGLATVDDSLQAGAESFTGGYITGRTVSVDHVPDRGGGVHVLASGTFSMYGGTIIGNAAAFGGGVYIGDDAEFNLIDGSIACNTVSGSGGGVDVNPGSKGFNMSGGSITNNTADRDAGGINLRKNCTFNMTGGSITDNTANGNRNHDGGGIWVSDQAGCNISGASKITGNKTDGADRNVYLAYGETNHETSKINVDRALSDGAAISITLGTTDGAGVFTTGLSGKLPDGKPASDIFFSDSTDYSVSETAGGEAQLVVRTDIASGTCSFNDATYAGKEISPQTMTLKLPDTDTRELKLGTDYEITKFKRGDADMGMSKPKYVGAYTATVKGIGIYKGEANVGFTIKPAPLTIKAIDQTLIYNGEIQGPGDKAYKDPAEIAEVVEVKGLEGTDELTSVVVDGQGQKVGQYDLIPSAAAVNKEGSGNGNYTITYVNGTLTITKAKPKPPQPKPDPKPQPKINKAAAKTALDAGVIAKSSGSKVTASWGAVKGASSYVIYANYCDQKKLKKIKTVSGKTTSFDITKLNGKKFNPKKNLKFYVVAYKTVKGKKVKLAKSIMAHAPGSKNSKRTNVTGVKVKKASFTLKKGKTAKIKAKLVLQKKSRKPLKHCAKFRYASSNKKVAKVSKKGKITAVGKGKCTVYVYAISGVSKKIKVTVR